MGYCSATWNTIESSGFYLAQMYNIDCLLFARLNDVCKLDLGEENEVVHMYIYTDGLAQRC